MHPKRALALLLALAAATATTRPAAGQGFTVLVNPSGDRQLAALSTANGSFHLLGSPLAGESLSSASDAFTLDRNNNRYLFVGTPNGDPTKLFVVSTVSGAVLASPNLTNAQNGVTMLEYDHGEGVLYALLSVGSGDRQLGTVNIATGAVTLLGTPIAGTGLSTGGARALDEAGNRFFFVGTPNGQNEQLFVIDTTDGDEIASPDVSGPFIATRDLAWDDDDSTLFGLFTTASSDAQVGTFNIGTGAVSLRGNPLTGGSVSSFAVGMDATADRYYVAAQPSGGNHTVYTLSTVTGNEVSSHEYSSGILDIVRGRFDPGPLFADGFESGNLNAWSAHVP